MQIKTETKVGLFVIGALAIFFYISFHIGVFRLDRGNYRQYTVYFDDISGLDKKADVKIAGVKVGWVEKAELVDDEYQAKAFVMINKKYRLYKNAHAKVRQESLLGTKYLEVNPGDTGLSELASGDPLDKPGRSPVSIDDILYQMKDVAFNLQEITGSFKETFGGIHGREQLKTVVDNLQQATEKIAGFSSTLDRTLSHNEDNINWILQNFREFSLEMKETIPTVKDSIDKIATVFDRDISEAAVNIKQLSTSLEDASLNARDSFKHINSISEKINDGTGTIGKLINEEDTYYDLREAASGLKNYFAKINALRIIFDAHGEWMYRPAENFVFFGDRFEDTKGYLDIRIHPNDDYFYVAQLVGSQKGTTYRKKTFREWRDENGCILPTSELLEKKIAIPELVGEIDEIVRVHDTFKFGFQIGKIYKDFAFRFGLFENTVGMAVDFDIPFDTENFRWVTSLEAFDFRGRDRIDDSRPHLKWINRLFIMRNLYFAFGADDFISKENANGFFGGGLRFCDEDIKYLAGKIGLTGFAS